MSGFSRLRSVGADFIIADVERQTEGSTDGQTDRQT